MIMPPERSIDGILRLTCLDTASHFHDASRLPEINFEACCSIPRIPTYTSVRPGLPGNKHDVVRVVWTFRSSSRSFPRRGFISTNFRATPASSTAAKLPAENSRTHSETIRTFYRSLGTSTALKPRRIALIRARGAIPANAGCSLTQLDCKKFQSV
jgi:hypothetical protein